MAQRKILVVSICCVITLFLMSSYAILTTFDMSDNIITFQTGNLKMSINNTNGLINLNGKLPESDKVGLATATPITVTLTNTGTIDIMKYDVKLINQIDKENLDILSDDYIKIAISMDEGANYTILGNLGSLDNKIYTGYNLGVSKSKTIYIKVWIDEKAGNEVLGKTYYGSVAVDLYQKTDFDLTTNILNNIEAKKLSNKSCTNITVEEDGITYLSGNRECIDFNYVWYSGKLWMVTSINSDRSLKLILANDMTVMPYGANKNFYTNETTKSYVYEWLNEDFLDTLHNAENIIVEDALWNASPGNGSLSSKLPVAGQSEVYVNSSVGLMNSYEYYKSYQNLGSYAKGYLNFGYYRYLLNPYNATAANVWAVNATGNGQSFAATSMLSIQPSIVLQSDLLIDGGTGSINAPFRLKDDKEDIVPNSTLLNTRTSGEYVKFGGELFRIVGIENNTTKLNRVDYIKDENEAEVSKMFASSITYGKSDNEKTAEYWDYYLNTTWLKKIDSTYNEAEGTSSILTKGTYYIKTYVSGNYKNAVCNSVSNGTTIKDCEKTTNTWIGYVGLPRYAEMFTGSSATFTWIITQYNTIRIWCVGNDGRIYNGTPATAAAVRPSIHIKSEIVIKSGDGTEQSPFMIGLAN